jgi:LytS/YehU family sensor histidine kinase
VRATRVEDDLVLSVRDEGTAPPARASNGIGIGLVNTRERLTTLYGPRGGLELTHPETGGTIATVRLPYRALRHA